MNGEAAIPDGAGAAALALVTVAIRDKGVIPDDWDEACGDADPKAVAVILASITGGLYNRLADAAPDAGTVEEQWAKFCAGITAHADSLGITHFL